MTKALHDFAAGCMTSKCVYPTGTPISQSIKFILNLMYTQSWFSQAMNAVNV